MSRGKPNPPPVVLKIEALSSGLAQPHAAIVDDFGPDEVIEQVLPYGPAKPLASAQELILADRRRAVLNKRLLLEHVGMLPKSAEYEQARAEGKAIKQSVLVPKVRVHSKHQAFELTFKPKPKPKWRRV